MKQKIAIIIGTTRPGRVGDKIANWYFDQVKDTAGADFEVIDLKEVNLPLLDETIPASQGKYQNDHTKEWAKKIAGFDAYIWVTPEYNHTAPASLLNAISFVNPEWHRKPVAMVSYGGMGGVRAAEHLRQVAGELQMAAIRLSVMVREPWVAIDEAGNVKPEFIHGNPVHQIEDLLWWANALSEKRQTIS